MRLGIIVGSTRQNRQTLKQAKWVLDAANAMEGTEAELVDLKGYPMPFFDEPISPRYNQNRQIDLMARRWLAKMKSFDAYVFVTPEYNHSIPGVLKNAIDYITWEMLRKPALIVSHGAAGGARAQVQLKVILSESRAVPIPSPSALAMAGMSDKIDEDGNLKEELKAGPYSPQTALEDTLQDLKWYSDTLGPARAQAERALAPSTTTVSA